MGNRCFGKCEFGLRDTTCWKLRSDPSFTVAQVLNQIVFRLDVIRGIRSLEDHVEESHDRRKRFSDSQ